ncbi:hypothetical protein ACFL20_08175 [Spirochaetota bacterium]
MKKIHLVLLLVFVLSIPTYAVNVIFGAKAGYFVWEPYIQDAGGFFENMKQGGGILYGPVVSLIATPDISFSVAYLTGNQSASWQMNFEQEGDEPDDIRAGTYSWSLKRHDLDSALSYRLTENFKLFIGYKLQYTNSALRQTEVRNDSMSLVTQAYHSKDEIETFGNGPAIGVGYAHVFGNGFFVAANLSALYMRGYFKVEGDFYYSAFGSPIEWQEEPGSPPMKISTNQFGLNIDPTVGYKPQDIGIIFTLGFRYQWLRTEFADLTTEKKEAVGDPGGLNDHQYGVFFSVLYTI